jgi:hypothetical protein
MPSIARQTADPNSLRQRAKAKGVSPGKLKRAEIAALRERVESMQTEIDRLFELSGPEAHDASPAHLARLRRLAQFDPLLQRSVRMLELAGVA